MPSSISWLPTGLDLGVSFHNHTLSLESLDISATGNGSLMAALDAGYVHTLWPLRHTYALVKGRASSENVFTLFFFFPYNLLLASHLPSCAQLSSRLSFFSSS